MEPVWRDALNIVKGEMNGDVFYFEAEFEDDKGAYHVGGWKSELKRLGLMSEDDAPEFGDS